MPGCGALTPPRPSHSSSPCPKAFVAALLEQRPAGADSLPELLKTVLNSVLMEQIILFFQSKSLKTMPKTAISAYVVLFLELSNQRHPARLQSGHVDWRHVALGLNSTSKNASEISLNAS